MVKDAPFEIHTLDRQSGDTSLYKYLDVDFFTGQAFGLTWDEDEDRFLLIGEGRLRTGTSTSNKLFSVPVDGSPTVLSEITLDGAALSFSGTEEGSGITFYDGTVYCISSRRSALYSLDISTGALTSLQTINGLGEALGLTTDGENLYYNREGDLYCVPLSDTSVSTHIGYMGNNVVTDLTTGVGLSWDGEKIYMITTDDRFIRTTSRGEDDSRALFTIDRGTGEAIRVATINLAHTGGSIGLTFAPTYEVHATETRHGIVELATEAEAEGGAATDVVLTPATAYSLFLQLSGQGDSRGTMYFRYAQNVYTLNLETGALTHVVDLNDITNLSVNDNTGLAWDEVDERFTFTATEGTGHHLNTRHTEDFSSTTGTGPQIFYNSGNSEHNTPLSYNNGTLYSYNWRNRTFKTNSTTRFVTTDSSLGGNAKSAMTYVTGSGVHIFEHNTESVRKVTFGSTTTNGSFTTLGDMSSVITETANSNCAMAWNGAYIYVVHGSYLYRMDKDTGDSTRVVRLSSASTGAVFGRQTASQYDMTFKPA